MVRILVAAAVAAVPLAARDDTGPKDGGHVRLVQVSSGKALSVEPPEPGGDEIGTRAVVARADDKDKAQQWKVVAVKGHFRLVNRKTGQVLDVSGASADDGAPVIQWEDNGEDNQLWGWAGDGKERRLTSKSSGLVVDTDTDGKLVQRKADAASKAQLWAVVPVPK